MRTRSTAMIRDCRGRILRGASAVVGNRSFGIVVSSDEQARDDLALNMEAWILPRSGRCPLIDSHNDRSGIRSVLGYVDEFEVKKITLPGSGRPGKALLGTATFADASVSEEADAAFELYRAGICDSFSVSFIPKFDGRDFVTPTSQELIEVSCVAIPADINSVVIARVLRAQLAGRDTEADRRVLRAAQLRRDPTSLTAQERLTRAQRLKAEARALDDDANDRLRRALLGGS